MVTWDETKRKANLAKHGVDFADAERFDWENALIEEDDSEAYGEQREIATGFIGAQLYVYVYTLWDEEDHAITLRKATPQEANRYAREFRSSHRS